ncbi:YajG family lipoprotein [Zooshikella sp. RANM57]|uniref:YajG family lipoprotein n=1 Tax=Zooshikella sp. RANM57 TaxID=3425863 RepID=UPI003D6EED53
MMKKMISAVCLGLSILLTMTGCVLSPQQIDVNPTITLPTRVPVVQRTVTVNVQDSRPTKVLGTRGGLYDKTSTITIHNDLTRAIKHAVEQGLLQMEMQVDNQNPSVKFNVYIEEMNYDTPDSNYVTQVNVSATVKAVVEIGFKRYTGRYQSSAKHRVVKAPSDVKNQEIINDLLNDGLSRMFNDQSLIRFMRSNP